ncbi:MAG: energy transducer TonB [Luteimonas sp.]|nr:energy transducer TonB [Luteimonas sp.]
MFDDPGPTDFQAPPPSPPAPPSSSPDIAGGDVDASTRSQFPIAYPPAAARAGITGTVVVQVTYDAQGRITDAKIFRSSRNRDLDRAALQGVRRWTVNPGRRNGQAVGGVANVTVDFNF